MEKCFESKKIEFGVTRSDDKGEVIIELLISTKSA